MFAAFGIEPHISKIIESFVFSFIPFLINSVVLFSLLSITPNIDIAIHDMIKYKRDNFFFNHYVSFTTFKLTGNICAILFIFTLILQIKKKLNISLLTGLVCVISPPLAVYIFSIVASFL